MAATDHGSHGGGGGGPRGPRGPVPGPVLAEPGPDRPGGPLLRDGPGVAAVHPAPVPGLAVGRAGAGNDRVPLRRPAIPRGRCRRAAQPPAGHDAAHLPGHPGRLRGQRRHRVRRVRPGVLVGAGPADRDHAAGPLAGDAGPRPGLQRAGRPGGAAARRGRPGHPVGDRDGAGQRPGRGRRGPGPPGRPGPGRRRGRRRGGRAGRVDDHRRVPPGAQAGGRPGGGGNGGDRLGDPGPGGGGGGGDRPGRDPPAGRAGPELPFARPGPGRPGGRAAVLLRRRRRPRHPGGVDCSWASPTRRSSARSRCW